MHPLAVITYTSMCIMYFNYALDCVLNTPSNIILYVHENNRKTVAKIISSLIQRYEFAFLSKLMLSACEHRVIVRFSLG